MKPKATTSKKTIKIVNAFDKRDLYIQAILNGRLNGLIKLDYPFSNALLTNVIYTDVNHLFKFALEVGKLEVTYIKKDIQKLPDCNFFICTNCKTDKNKDKFIINLCENCATKQKAENEKRVNELYKKPEIKYKVLPSENENIKYSQFLKDEKSKKKINPIKLKF